MITNVNAYLNFAGTAEKAIKLYETALGAKAEGVIRFGDVPEAKAPPEHKNRIMHALLHIGNGAVMISDAPPSMKIPAESNVQVALAFDDAAELTKCFDALARDGKVALPLHETDWAEKFGMLTDAFGIKWMLNCAKKK